MQVYLAAKPQSNVAPLVLEGRRHHFDVLPEDTGGPGARVSDAFARAGRTSSVAQATR